MPFAPSESRAWEPSPEKVGVAMEGEVPNTKAPEPVSSSIRDESSAEASISVSMSTLIDPQRISSSARVSIEVEETLSLKRLQSTAARQPKTDEDAVSHVVLPFA